MKKKCEICGRLLENPNSPGHIKSKFHQDALAKVGDVRKGEGYEDGLIKAETGPSEDSALELIKTESVAEKSEVKETLEEEKKEIKKPKVPLPLEDPKPPEKLPKMELEPLKPIENEPISKEREDMNNGGLEYGLEEEIELFTPEVPEPPKRKTIDSSSLSIEIRGTLQDENDEIKNVLVNCYRCNEIISIPVPKYLVLESELPVVPISFVHKDRQGQDQHCITIHLDHDFDIRRQRLSDVLIDD